MSGLDLILRLRSCVDRRGTEIINADEAAQIVAALEEDLVDGQQLEADEKVCRESCQRGRHAVQAVLDTEETPTLWLACPYCDRVWTYEPLVGPIETEVNDETLERIRREAGLI